MKGSNIVSAIQNIVLAKEHFQDFNRQNPGSKGARLFAGYVKRMDWIQADFMACPLFDDAVREGIKREVEADAFAVPAITEKFALLPPDLRDKAETFIDELLKSRQ